jgi:RNA polymerase sigma-70 factor (ECF subfamily)
MMDNVEKYLIEAVKKGDYRAFEILFNSYYPAMCKYAHSMVHSIETAEDLVSDIFVKFWEQPVTLSVNTSLKGYLFRTVHNTCLNYLSRKNRTFQNLDAQTVEKLQMLIPDLTVDDSSGVLVAAELEKQINQTVEELPEECGRIFKMSRQEGLSHREIAQKLNISENTVKVQIYRALFKIKESLKKFL